MENDTPPHALPGDINTANIGAGAAVEQFAQGSNITQIKGYTAEQVRVLIADIRASYQPKPFDGRSPYVGLASFQEQDADRFFGREKLTQELVARIETARFFVIAGPSGSGKSSLARAGLFHALRNGALDGSENWLYEILTPGRHPLEQLARVVSSFAKSTRAGDEVQLRGRDDATLLHRWADIALGDQPTRRAILLVDQFEESFTQADEAERAAFFNLLLYAAIVEDGRVTIVVCTRSDFIGNWAAHPNLNAQLSQGVNQIPPIQPDELVSAIARPALQIGLQIDPALVKQILDDMRDAPGALPLMQFALDDLFEYEKSKGGVIALTRDDYLERGGLQKALERHADAEFAKLNAEEQQIARSVFASLIEPGRGSVDTRRTALFEEIAPVGSDATQVKNVVDKLATARLVTTDEKTVTLAHEQLIDAWGWLRRLIDENREAIALKNKIDADAQIWEQSKRDASYLYTGARLATAQEQVAEKKIALSAAGQAFVDAGIAAREEEKRKEARRTRRLIMAFGAAAAVFAVLAILAFLAQQNATRSEAKAQAESTRAIEQQQTAEAERDRAEQAEADALSAADAADTAAREAGRQKILAQDAQKTAVAEAKISRSRELSAQSLVVFEADPDLAGLLAVEAARITETNQTRNALRNWLRESRQQRVLRGHTDIVQDAAFSPNGQRVITASSDGTARVWDAQTGSLGFVLSGHSAGLYSARFSPDGSQILTFGRDGTARIWDATTRVIEHVFDATGGIVTDAEFSPDGKHVLTVHEDRTVRVWKVADGSQLHILRGHTDEVKSAIFSSDGKFILTAARFEDEPVRLWDAATGSQVQSFRRQNNLELNHFFGAMFSPDGTSIIGWGSGVIYFWDRTTGRVQHRVEVYEQINDFVLSHDGKKFAVALANGTARIHELAAPDQAQVLYGHETWIGDIEFSPDDKLVLTASWDRTARLWDVSTGKELVTLRGHSNQVFRAAFSPDGARIITTSTDHTARMWDTNPSSDFSVIQGHTGRIWRAIYSPDGKLIASISADRTARIWDAETGKSIHVLERALEFTDIAFSPDGKRILTAGNDGVARLWDTMTGTVLAQFSISAYPERGTNLHTVAFSPDGKRIMTSGKFSRTVLWDATTGSELTLLPRGMDSSVWRMSFSADGKRLVTSQGQSPTVWHLETLTPLFSLKGHSATVQGHAEEVWSARYSPDGRRIVTAGGDHTARIWDAETGKGLVTLRGHEDAVSDAVFSPDGRMIVTASHDHTARIWDAISGAQQDVLRGHNDAVTSAVFHPTGKYILTASRDMTMHVYIAGIPDLVHAVISRIGRALTCEERVQYLHESIDCATPTPRN